MVNGADKARCAREPQLCHGACLKVPALTVTLLAAETFTIAVSLIHVASIAAAIGRFRRKPDRESPPYPPVTLVRPLCGIDNYAVDTLRTTFELDHPQYEILFCVASARDPVIPLVRDLIAEYGGANAKILIGDDRVSANPKLNNVIKGWRPAADRLASAWLLGRARMRVSQYLSGALAISHRHAGRRFCPRQNHAVAARRPGKRRRHRGFGQGGRRRCGFNQDRARHGPQGALDRSPARPAAWLPYRVRSLESAIALGAAAARQLLFLFSARDFFRRRAADADDCVSGARSGVAGCAQRARLRCILVRRRNVSSRRGRLAYAALLPALRPVPRSPAAGAVRRGAQRQRLCLARQCNAGRAHGRAAPPRAGARPPARAKSRERRPAPPALAARAAVGAVISAASF